MQHVLLEKSKIPPNFDELVEKYRKELMEHCYTVNTPAPSADPLVQRCILRVQRPEMCDDFIPCYTIIDDTPPPPTFEEKKHALIGVILAGENKLKAAVIPPGKARLLQIQQQDILAKEVLTPDDKAILDDYADKLVRMDNIHRFVAHTLAEIEDLTAETVDAWVPPPDLRS